MTDERDPVELASAAIEEAARALPPLPLPIIDTAAAGFGPGPVPERVEVTYTPYVETGFSTQMVWTFDDLGTPEQRALVQADRHCRVYWGSHGCHLERGHPVDVHCLCDCECANHPDPNSGCVCAWPFYGPDTNFYGEDAKARGLRTHDDP